MNVLKVLLRAVDRTLGLRKELLESLKYFWYLLITFPEKAVSYPTVPKIILLIKITCQKKKNGKIKII